MTKDISMENTYSRDPVFMINDFETLKVLSDPLRIQILERLAPKPQTVNQVAEGLGLASSRLYYHFKMLESHGLIKVVETRLVNNMIERDYWLVAEEIRIDKNLFSFSSEEEQENIIQVIRSSWEATHEDMMRTLQARQLQITDGQPSNPQEMVMLKLQSQLSPKSYKAFIDQFNQLMEEFNHPEEDVEDLKELQEYHLACFIYPSYSYDEESPKEDENDNK
jgi:DNA-binding transcriptional ArsR family regulator